MPLRSLPLLIALLLAALAPGLAQARGAAQLPAQVVDGYHVTIALPAEGAQTGPNAVVVTIHAADGAPQSDAAVTIAVVAYAAADGHGASHTAPASQGNAAGRTDAMPGMSMAEHAGMAPAEPSGNHAAGDGHGDHAADGHGAEAIPTTLEPDTTPGSYVGTLHLAQPGSATVTVAFTVAGVARAALFTVPVAQARPRALVLGGFALVNGLAIGAAAVLKHRMPRKTRRPAAPRPPVIPLSPVPAAVEEERPQ